MSKRLEFYFDYGSPFSYLADTQLAELARRTGATIVYKPILLGAVLKATGSASPMAVPAKGKYMGTELRRWAQRYGVPVPANSHFPVNTLRIMRGAVAAAKLGCFARYHAAIYKAFWRDGLDLGDDAGLRKTLAGAGLDADALLAAIEDADVKDRLRANTEEALARGVFGAPAFFVADEMFWGNYRLDWVEAALSRQS